MARLIAPPSRLRFWFVVAGLLALTLVFGVRTLASDAEKPIKRNYAAVFAPPAPETRNSGCVPVITIGVKSFSTS